jgi:DNA-binding response OmpR family regulator
MSIENKKVRTVLVCDDEPIFREMVGEILRTAGYRVLSAEDGQEGWEKLEKTGADMAVLDLNMPRLDGIGLIRRVRKDSRFSELPIMLLTVRGLVEDQVQGFERGADDYLTKPFDRQMFLARLRVLERRIIG